MFWSHKVGKGASRAMLVGMVMSSLGAAARGEDLIPLRMGAASNIAFGPNFVMDDNQLGIARKHGLNLDVKVFASGVATMEAALAGDLDVAIMNTAVGLPLIATGKACFKGPIDFIDIGSVTVVGKTDIRSVQDLAGKKVGTVAGAVGNTALHLWLDMHHIPRDKVKVVNVQPPDMPIALARGDVDAIIWSEPTPGKAIEMIGADKAHYVGDISEAYRDVAPLNVTCKWANKYGDKGMEDLTAAWIEAVDYLYANPGKAAEITGKRLQTPPEEVLRLWKQGGWLDKKGWGADLTDSEVDMLNTNGRYLMSVGKLDKLPDLGIWISSKWLRAVAPDRVKLERHNNL